MHCVTNACITCAIVEMGNFAKVQVLEILVSVSNAQRLQAKRQFLLWIAIGQHFTVGVVVVCNFQRKKTKLANDRWKIIADQIDHSKRQLWPK